MVCNKEDLRIIKGSVSLVENGKEEPIGSVSLVENGKEEPIGSVLLVENGKEEPIITFFSLSEVGESSYLSKKRIPVFYCITSNLLKTIGYT